MKEKYVVPFLTILFALLPETTLSQAPEQMPGIIDPVTIEKLYLHTDRQYYFLGDSLWFKGYYLNGQTQHLYPGYSNMYIELIDDAGETILSKIYAIEEGVTMGNIVLADTLMPGQYLLRAYTDIQKQIGEDAFFYKTLQVSKIQSSLDQQTQTAIGASSAKVDLAFLPEGGYLLEGQMNTVGIKTMDSSGKSVRVEGRIVDEEGKTIGTFLTAYKGMDSVRFRPERGNKYHIVLADYPEFEHYIGDIKKRGIKLECTGETDDEFLFRVSSNASSFQGKDYVFAIMHRGTLVYEQEFLLKNKDFPIKVSREALPAGINRFILLDAALTPLSERLCFSSNQEVNHIQIESDQYAYSTRSPVEIRLSDEEDLGGMGWSSLSLSVVSEHAVDKNGNSLDILSWLLIDSELKGAIESPSDFLVDDDTLSSHEKLNMLMLTQGWSRYLWNTLPEEAPEYDLLLAEGIPIAGNVRKALSKKPVQNGLVNCFIFSNKGFLSETTFTDEHGDFLFPDLYFTDTVAIFLQGFNRKGKLYTEVFMESIHAKAPGVSPIFIPDHSRFDDFPVRLYQQQYYNEMAMRDYLIESGSILLDEVSITRKYVPKGDGLPRIYQKPRDSFKITEKDLGYQTVAQFLKAKLGALFYAPQISFTSGASSQLVLLNGHPVDYPEMVMELPLSDVDVVEYLSHKDVSVVGMFGSRGAAGVISVFTKKGGGQYVKTYVQGTLSQRITGFSTAREFYSPKYTPENLHSEKPDRRITLYWNPDINTMDGKADVSFYTSDDISRYRVFVEGITNIGEVCLGSSEFVVSRDHADLLTE